MKLNQQIVDTVKKNFQDALDMFGKEITLYFHSTATCTTCTINPLTGESMNPNCSACDGTGLVYTEQTSTVKGITKSFIGNLGFSDPSRSVSDYIPVGDARITCNLTPFLTDPNEPEGDTIFEEMDYLSYDGKEYKVKQHDFTNIGNFYIAVLVLERYNGRDVKL